MTARAAIRQVLAEMVPQDAVSRGTGAARGLANISTERRHLPQADFGLASASMFAGFTDIWLTVRHDLLHSWILTNVTV